MPPVLAEPRLVDAILLPLRSFFPSCPRGALYDYRFCGSLSLTARIVVAPLSIITSRPAKTSPPSSTTSPLPSLGPRNFKRVVSLTSSPWRLLLRLSTRFFLRRLRLFPLLSEARASAAAGGGIGLLDLYLFRLLVLLFLLVSLLVNRRRFLWLLLHDKTHKAFRQLLNFLLRLWVVLSKNESPKYDLDPELPNKALTNGSFEPLSNPGAKATADKFRRWWGRLDN